MNSGIALPKRRPYKTPVPDASQTTASHATKLLRRSLANGRLGHAYLFVGSTIESLESHATELARTQIIQQAATAMLAQANASKQNVLSLLQG